jgi:hypothetical protein
VDSLWSFFLKGDIFSFVATVDVFLRVLFFLLLKEALLLRVNSANILETIHIFFRFIKTKLVIVSKMVKNSFVSEVYEDCLLLFDYLFNLLNDLLIGFAIKHFCVKLPVL